MPRVAELHAAAPAAVAFGQPARVGRDADRHPTARKRQPARQRAIPPRAGTPACPRRYLAARIRPPPITPATVETLRSRGCLLQHRRAGGGEFQSATKDRA